MTQVAVGIGPLVPDAYTALLKPVRVSVAVKEPEQLVNDGFKVQFLGGKERESLLKIESHLVSEHTDCAGAGAVTFLHSFTKYSVKQVEILFH